MLMLLSVLEDYFGEESESSSSSQQQEPSDGSERSFSASPVTNFGEALVEGTAAPSIVTPPLSKRSPIQCTTKPLGLPSISFPTKKRTYGSGYSYSSNGLNPLLLYPSRHALGYNGLEKQFQLTTQGASSSELHRACRSNSSDIASHILSIIKFDHSAVRSRAQLARLTVDPGSFYRHERQPQEPYTLPINLVLLHQSPDNPKALGLLAKAGADVLTLPDGPDQEGSLSIALKLYPQNWALVDLLLKANPACAMVTDMRQNLPLHIACLRGSPLPVIRRLYLANPRAMYQPNWNGEAPYHIVQRNPTLASHAVSDYFFAVSARRERRKPRRPMSSSSNQ